MAGAAPGIPFADGHFDAVVASLVVGHFTDYRPALADLARVLRPGGRLGITTWGRLDDAPAIDDSDERAAYAIWDAVAETYLDLDAVDNAATDALPWEDWFTDPANVRAAMHGCDLQVVDLFGRAYRYPLSHADWLSRVNTGARARYAHAVLGDAGFVSLNERRAGRAAHRRRERPDPVRRRSPHHCRHARPSRTESALTEAEALTQALTARLAPLDRELGLAWWESSTHASPDADARRAAADLAATRGPRRSGRVRRGAGSPRAGNSTNRALVVLHDAMLPQQIPSRPHARTRRPRDCGRRPLHRLPRRPATAPESTTTRCSRSCGRATTPHERRAAWEAGKQIGAEVGDDVRQLARLRNDAAHALGFRDHFALALATSELDEPRLFATLREVDELTAAPFRRVEGQGRRSARDAIRRRPQRSRTLAPRRPVLPGPASIRRRRSRSVLRERRPRGTDHAARIKASASTPTRSLPRSDLYARDGKNQHAFCIHIDREGDVRVLCNVEPNERWADTMLHEFGHAVYDRDLDPALPWLLREPAHALTTEGIAMMFGRLVRDPVWLRDVAGIDAADVDALAPHLAAAQRASLLVFARWVLVVTHFEQQLYANPDADLDTIWWDLVERFQFVRRPEGRHAPDWAAKIHLAVVPVYYQNYLYGEMFASQLMERLTNGAGSLVDRVTVGTQLHDTVFRPAAGRRWDALIEDATGAPLGAAAFARAT